MKKNKLKRIFALFLILLLLITLSSCLNDGERVNIACFANITHSQALYGEATGLFGKYAADKKTEWFTFNAGPSEMESIIAGSINIGYIGPIPAITGYEASGGSIRIIAGVTDAGSVLVSRKDAGIESVKDLSGKTVVVPQFGNTQDILLRELLSDNGLSSTEQGGTVNIIQQSNSYVEALFNSKQIDAALVPEPWGTRLIEEAGANIVLDSNEILGGDYTVAVMVTTDEYLKNNRETVKNVLKAHVEATLLSQSADDYNSKTNERLGTLSSVKLDENLLNNAFSRMKVTYNPNIKSIEMFIDVCFESGAITSKFDVKNIVDLSVLNEVLEESGLEKITE